MPKVLEYQSTDGASPFRAWFTSVEARAAAKIRRAVDKLGRGLRPDVKPVGQGVFEARIDYGPGYRVYFGLDGDETVILLGGGNKARQDRDIRKAQDCWADYKHQKKEPQHGTANPRFP